MKKSLSFLIALSTLALSAPIGLAEDASSASSSSSTSSVTSSEASSSASSMKPCEDKKGLEKAACMLRESKAKNKNTSIDRRNSHAGQAMNTCEGKKGNKKILCLRKIVIKKVEKKIIKRASDKPLNHGQTIKDECGGVKGHERAQCVLEQNRMRKMKKKSSASSSSSSSSSAQ